MCLEKKRENVISMLIKIPLTERNRGKNSIIVLYFLMNTNCAYKIVRDKCLGVKTAYSNSKILKHHKLA